VVTGASAPFNFAFLMNQDAQVHLHVLPRYASPRQWNGQLFHDPHWGRAPGHEQRPLDTDDLAQLADEIRAHLAPSHRR
jgi:diadenosine tetraphosphate (Ap4A) HIT family hydrolase